jgi:hypothetical protein
MPDCGFCLAASFLLMKRLFIGVLLAVDHPYPP